ncbi:pentapeptide repeat-containing protein [Corynebacterium diphtheriae]|nr:pentapeptide repeat-containing protein [Corynebacterium diphtheriae]
MSRLTREDVEKIVKKAGEEGKTPYLCDVDLHGVVLSGADLRGANLWGADLRSADLSGANLWGADLRGADLCGANLWGADLRSANLRGANLRGADLRGADLSGVDLADCFFDGLQISKTPSGQVTLIPTCDGWWMQVGCWSGTPEELKALIAQDEGWPEAQGEEILRRRPYLEAVLALCEVHMADHTQVIDDLKARWGGDDEE